MRLGGNDALDTRSLIEFASPHALRRLGICSLSATPNEQLTVCESTNNIQMAQGPRLRARPARMYFLLRRKPGR